MALLSSTFLVDPINCFPNPKHSFGSHCPKELFVRHRNRNRNRNRRLSVTVSGKYEDQNLNESQPAESLRQFTASAILLLGLGIRVCAAAASTQTPAIAVADRPTVIEDHIIQGNDDVEKSRTMENIEDKELNKAFEKWKSKTYALTVPLRIVALRGSIPPSWVKDFMQSQGRRAILCSETCGSLDDIFSDISSSLTKGKFDRKSALAADIVTVGDSWLNFAIKKGLIEPLQGVEDQDWFKGLSDKWKVYLCRNSEGNLDPEGKIWAAPYRWGSMVIAYKKTKFQKHNLAPIEDWADLWRPELAGKISMVDSPREVVGAVLKCMGAAYNTNNIDAQVVGGRNVVQQKLAQLKKQVRLFDSVHYLKAFGVGDVWVAVGWSSDVLPAAKRMSNVSVIVPKSGASLWADLWAIPAASRLTTNQNKIGGRVRGPSPLVEQWIEFCLQAGRAVPFQQEVIPGASPSALESDRARARARVEEEESKELTTAKKGKPKLDTNLIDGVPPPEILDQCEFLVPLSDAALADYQWLIASMQKPHLHYNGLIHRMQHFIFSIIQTLWPKKMRSQS
ncbi:uncharacterized protein LOC114296657 [Camellia sinensis]|uniref:uncharacterized protein LOC114296657 n=1 Tax=Camellia sinensis TaxID=4442 RepID=UPI001035EDD6|nr:uncharacterized protein LOC114296657 [Camellia sinensis]